MFCEHFADKKWLAMMERRSRREEAHAQAKERDAADQSRLFSKAVIEDDDVDVTLDEADEDQDDIYVAEDIKSNNTNVDRTSEKVQRTNCKCQDVIASAYSRERKTFLYKLKYYVLLSNEIRDRKGK